jgi:hypothetical protein
MITGSSLAEQHFDPAEFDGFVGAHGTPVLWRRARLCPCLDPITGQARASCGFCLEIPGVLWDDGAPVVCFVPSRQQTDVFDQAGKREQGVVLVTFPSGVTPGPYDRLDLPIAEIVVNNERLVRGERDGIGRSRERLRLPPVRIEYLESIVGNDPLADPPADGVLAQWVADADYTLGLDGSITWIGAAGPAVGTLYTVRYIARPAFVCWSPMSRDEGGVKQPYKSLAQRLDFFRQRSVGE